MLRLPRFRFRQAQSVQEAADILAGEPGTTRLLAGGTDLWPNMKRRHQKADTVVALRGIPELHGIGIQGAEITIGAMMSLTQVTESELLHSRHPALVRAVQSISAPVLRNMGTIGGNLCLDTRCTYYNQNEEWRRSIDYCMKEEGEICWVAPGSSRCWAISASDSAPILCAIDAQVELVSKSEERRIPVRGLYANDGIEYLSKRPDEVLTKIILTAKGEQRTAFWKLSRRGSIDFSVLTVAAALKLAADATVETASIFLGSVASFPCPAKEAEAALKGEKLTAESIAHAARLARKSAAPLHNTDFAPQWRGVMVEKYVEAALREIAGLEVKRLSPRHRIHQ